VLLNCYFKWFLTQNKKNKAGNKFCCATRLMALFYKWCFLYLAQVVLKTPNLRALDKVIAYTLALSLFF
jgi:hypothetical protein